MPSRGEGKRGLPRQAGLYGPTNLFGIPSRRGFLREGAEFVQVLLFLEQGPHPSLKFKSVDGLDEKVIPPGFEALGFAFEVRQAGDEEDLDVAGLRTFFQPAAKIEPIHPGQKDIQEEKVHVMPFQAGEGCFRG